MDINTKLDLIDLMMSTNPYDKNVKELLKESITKTKEKEGYAHLPIIDYLDLQTMLEEMEL
jgi:hypothetical protein